MNQNIKNVLTSGLAIAVGFVVFAVVRQLINSRLGTPEAKANASGILCYCRRPNGTIKVQECGSKYKTCDECCGHYGFDNDVASGY